MEEEDWRNKAAYADRMGSLSRVGMTEGWDYAEWQQEGVVLLHQQILGATQQVSHHWG